MLAKIFSAATLGLESVPIEVEVDIASSGLPSFTIVGLPDKAVEESKERVRSAIKNSGASFPNRRITINLAPADLPKEGPAYDLPIALGILVADGQINAPINKSLVLGELSLDGSPRHTNGILPITLLAACQGFKEIFLPQVNAQEAAVVTGIKIYPVQSLIQLFSHLTGLEKISPQKHLSFETLISEKNYEFDFTDIRGQEHAKRALEIAASGGHNCFMIGPPGAGKTMLARAFPSILPNLTKDEALEVTKIYSITGNLPVGESIIKSRPFRSPHHTTSRNGLIGGGSRPKPGEISLAHRGVLFLDEFPEFPRHVLEALRQPLEDGVVQVSRASGTLKFPSRFILIAASNPCPCGYYGSPKKPCTCLPGQILRYRKRLSGPLMDRIDIHINIPQVKIDKLTRQAKTKQVKSSKIIQKIAQKARNIQTKRFKDTALTCNAEMQTKDIKKFCPLDIPCLSLLRQAAEKFNLSARSYFKIIKIARTIADLSAENQIKPNHIAEALQYRPSQDFNL
jgi:magnesium chelatase family protein